MILTRSWQSLQCQDLRMHVFFLKCASWRPTENCGQHWPRWTRVPWINSEGRSMRPAQEKGTDTPSVTGRPAPQTIKNPENRPFMTWLTSPARKDGVLLLELNGCKRCGPVVCKFVAALFPQFCPKLYASPEAPLTRLTHTFYDSHGLK